MKTIRKKISTPFILIIFMIPFMTMILFNIALNIYIDRTGTEELKNNAASIEILIRQQLMENASAQTQNFDAVPGDENLTVLQEGLRKSKLSLLYQVKNMNIEFLLVSGEGRILFPKTYEDSFLNENLVDKARQELNKAGAGTIVKFHVGRNKYFAMDQELSNSPEATHLVFISSGSPIKRIVRVVNLILLSITLLAVGISSIIALIVSKSISKPITKLTGYAKRIGDNEYLSLPEDHSSVEIHELTRSMNEMSDRLKNYDNAQKSFLQNASHELRTPLMSIQGYAEGIAKGVFKDTAKTAEIICEESRRLNSLVEELLTLSRIENRNYKSDPAVQNISDVMREYVQRINGYAMKEQKSIRLENPDETIMAIIDEYLLSQAVMNIISNCIKYAKKEVTVSLFIENEFAVIRISDDGNGIAEEDLPHIFERFYKGKKGNFGLGLSIAKSAVDYMDGDIRAFNDDQGAVFVIRLPLVR